MRHPVISTPPGNEGFLLATSRWASNPDPTPTRPRAPACGAAPPDRLLLGSAGKGGRRHPPVAGTGLEARSPGACRRRARTRSPGWPGGIVSVRGKASGSAIIHCGPPQPKAGQPRQGLVDRTADPLRVSVTSCVRTSIRGSPTPLLRDDRPIPPAFSLTHPHFSPLDSSPLRDDRGTSHPVSNGAIASHPVPTA